MKVYSALGMITSAAACLSFGAQASAQGFDGEILIAKGEGQQLANRDVDNIVVGDPDIVSVTTNASGGLTIRGREEGVTTLFVSSRRRSRTILVRVLRTNPIALLEEVQELLGERSGVSSRIVKGRVVLEGEVSSQSYQKRVELLTTLYPNQVVNFANFRESFVEGAPMVALELDFVQLAIANTDNLGVRWGQFFGANLVGGSQDVPLFYPDGGGVGADQLPGAAGLTGGSGLTTYLSVVGNLNMALDLLAEQGLIRTHQHGILVTEGGKEGKYLSGGSILFPIAGTGAVDLIEKEFGLRFTATPVVDKDRRIKVSLAAEFTELDQSNGVNGVPALRSNEMSGVVNMQEGQSVLISGLLSDTESSRERGFAGLMRIPILGWLFKARNYQSNRTDNALFITPHIYEPGGKTHDRIVNAIFVSMKDGGLDEDELPTLSTAPAPKPAPVVPTPAAPSGSTEDLEFEE